MTKEELRELLRLGIMNTRYVADATGISIVNINKFKNDLNRGMVDEKFVLLLTQLTEDGVHIKVLKRQLG